MGGSALGEGEEAAAGGEREGEASVGAADVAAVDAGAGGEVFARGCPGYGGEMGG